MSHWAGTTSLLDVREAEPHRGDVQEELISNETTDDSLKGMDHPRSGQLEGCLLQAVTDNPTSLKYGFA